jgi:hypothetical protein
VHGSALYPSAWISTLPQCMDQHSTPVHGSALYPSAWISTLPQCMDQHSAPVHGSALCPSITHMDQHSTPVLWRVRGRHTRAGVDVVRGRGRRIRMRMRFWNWNYAGGGFGRLNSARTRRLQLLANPRHFPRRAKPRRAASPLPGFRFWNCAGGGLIGS